MIQRGALTRENTQTVTANWGWPDFGCTFRANLYGLGHAMAEDSRDRLSAGPVDASNVALTATADRLDSRSPCGGGAIGR